MTEKRPLEVNKLYILIDGAGRPSPVVVLDQVGFDPDHIELELSFRRTDNQVRITVNQNRLGREAAQIYDIRPVQDSEKESDRQADETGEDSAAS